MGLFKQETAYDRRKRELEEEAERVRKNMQMLMKSVKKQGAVPESSYPVYEEAEPVSVSVVEDEAPDSCLVTVDEDEVVEEAVVESPEPRASRKRNDELPPYGTARLRHLQNQRNENVPTYLASGSFGKRGPVTRERRIQRNKAIFMALLALIAIFTLISSF